MQMYEMWSNKSRMSITTQTAIITIHNTHSRDHCRMTLLTRWTFVVSALYVANSLDVLQYTHTTPPLSSNSNSPINRTYLSFCLSRAAVGQTNRPQVFARNLCPVLIPTVQTCRILPLVDVTNVVCSRSPTSGKSKIYAYIHIAVRRLTCHTATGTYMPYRITQCYLPPDRDDILTFTPAEAGTRLSNPGGMQGLS